MLLETGKKDKMDNKGTEESEFNNPDIDMRKAG
jgi:hypothetical protein